MDGYANLQERFGFIPMDHQEPRFFPVKEGAVYDNRGDVIPGHKRIYRVPMKTACERARRVTTLVEGKDWRVLEPA